MAVTSVGNNIVDGIYVGPYYASINGGVPTAVICDDFGDETYNPETWTADVYSPLNDGATRDAQKWAALNSIHAQPYTVAQDYNMVGWLANEMLLNLNNPAVVGQIDFALWAVFDPTAIPFVQQTGGTSWLTAAANYKNDSSYISGFTLYSPDTTYAISAPGSSTNPPQEFLVRTPEPPGLAVLALDLSGLAGLVFLLRRRARQPRS